MSPILAGLVVGISVPVLLFYVYGVVPVSLCRSGGCGVSTNGTGVRFDFDDENELMGSLGARNGGGKSIHSLIRFVKILNDWLQEKKRDTQSKKNSLYRNEFLS